MSKILARVLLKSAGIPANLYLEAYRDGAFGELIWTECAYRSIGPEARYTMEENLPALLDRMWDWMLYKRKTSKRSQQGPWIPIEVFNSWLRGLPEAEVGPSELAYALGTSPRRVYSWLHGEFGYVNYAIVEEVMFHYDGTKPEEVIPREKMYLARPKQKGEK